MRQSALPLTPTLSRKGRGGALACAAASLLPFRKKDRMRGFDVLRNGDLGYWGISG